MVGIVQLAEHRIVVPGVVGSSPITHPIKKRVAFATLFFIWYLVGNGTRKGSDATAAGGGERELSEWPRSVRDEGACAEDIHRAPQQDGRAK